MDRAIPSIIGSIGSDLNRFVDPASRWLTRPCDEEGNIRCNQKRTPSPTSLSGWVSSKVRTIRNGCNPSVFHFSKPCEARGRAWQAELTEFVGRLEVPAKGIEELLETFASLASRRPNLRLAFVGDGPGGRHLRSKAKRPRSWRTGSL